MDTKTRAMIAANSRWSEKKTKNTSVIYVDGDLAKRLKSGAKAEKKAVGDYLRDAIEAYDAACEMLGTLDIDNEDLKEHIEKMQKFRSNMHELESLS